jgi:hypothetical protein
MAFKATKDTYEAVASGVEPIRREVKAGQFIPPGWFSDEDCTQPLTGEEIETSDEPSQGVYSVAGVQPDMEPDPAQHVHEQQSDESKLSPRPDQAEDQPQTDPEGVQSSPSEAKQPRAKR